MICRIRTAKIAAPEIQFQQQNGVAVDLDLSAADVQPGALSTGAPCVDGAERHASREPSRAAPPDLIAVLQTPQGEAAREGLRPALN